MDTTHTPWRVRDLIAALVDGFPDETHTYTLEDAELDLVIQLPDGSPVIGAMVSHLDRSVTVSGVLPGRETTMVLPPGY